MLGQIRGTYRINYQALCYGRFLALVDDGPCRERRTMDRASTEVIRRTIRGHINRGIALEGVIREVCGSHGGVAGRGID